MAYDITSALGSALYTPGTTVGLVANLPSVSTGGRYEPYSVNEVSTEGDTLASQILNGYYYTVQSKLNTNASKVSKVSESGLMTWASHTSAAANYVSTWVSAPTSS